MNNCKPTSAPPSRVSTNVALKKGTKGLFGAESKGYFQYLSWQLFHMWPRITPTYVNHFLPLASVILFHWFSSTFSGCYFPVGFFLGFPLPLSLLEFSPWPSSFLYLYKVPSYLINSYGFFYPHFFNNLKPFISSLHHSVKLPTHISTTTPSPTSPDQNLFLLIFPQSVKTSQKLRCYLPHPPYPPHCTH